MASYGTILRRSKLRVLAYEVDRRITDASLVIVATRPELRSTIDMLRSEVRRAFDDWAYEVEKSRSNRTLRILFSLAVSVLAARILLSLLFPAIW